MLKANELLKLLWSMELFKKIKFTVYPILLQRRQGRPKTAMLQ